MRHTLHYLRIAVTALSLTAFVLLVALWVRSYYRWDSPNAPFWGNRWIQLNSLRGHLFVGVYNRESPEDFRNWNWRTLRADHLTDDGATGTVDWKFTWKMDALAFGVIETDALRAVFVRYSFLVILAAALAAIPWIKWPWRFRLRTLLIWVSLVAVLLGIDAMLGQ
ncbi:MAG TPA: hypothetical protein VGK58_13285 [Lacipirellulaceae bacterium]